MPKCRFFVVVFCLWGATNCTDGIVSLGSAPKVLLIAPMVLPPCLPPGPSSLQYRPSEVAGWGGGGGAPGAVAPAEVSYFYGTHHYIVHF